MQAPPLQRTNKILRAAFFSTLFVVLGAGIALASSGNIDATHKYAFSNVGGYINFAPDNGGVTVTDSALTGYAWSKNDGWINFGAAHGGVLNDGTGNLSGFAWDQAAGWVNFSGVTIDSSGFFHGQATGGTVEGASYGINFDCSSCSVITTWRAATAPPPPTHSGGHSSTSIGPPAPPTNPLPPPPPTSENAPPGAGTPPGSGNLGTNGSSGSGHDGGSSGSESSATSTAPGSSSTSTPNTGTTTVGHGATGTGISVLSSIGNALHTIWTKVVIGFFLVGIVALLRFL